MRVVELRDGFGLEALKFASRPEPTPGRGDVVVRMCAASLNYRDLQVVRGEYGHVQLPRIPVSDGAGEVVALGSGATRFRAGDRVCPSYVTDWVSGPPTAENGRRRLGGTLDGVLAEFVCLPEHALVKQPPHLTDVEAATLPIAGVTAWQALFAQGQLRPGDTLVVQGTGGVSVFAFQLARLAGARVIVTSSHDEKLERARGMGASGTINSRRQPDWHEEVLKLTEGRGADHVIDVVGGQHLSRSVAATKVGGTVSLVGYLGGMRGELDLPLAFRRVVTLQALSVGSRASFEALVTACETSGLHPVIDRVFPLAELRAALEYLASGRHFGKIAIAFDAWG